MTPCFPIQPAGVVQPEQDASVGLAGTRVLLIYHLHSQDNPCHHSWVPLAHRSIVCLLGLFREGKVVEFFPICPLCPAPSQAGFSPSLSFEQKSFFHVKLATLACWIPQWIPNVDMEGPLSGFPVSYVYRFSEDKWIVIWDLQPRAFVCEVHLEERWFASARLPPFLLSIIDSWDSTLQASVNGENVCSR